jgi:hypothetical protein
MSPGAGGIAAMLATMAFAAAVLWFAGRRLRG